MVAAMSNPATIAHTRVSKAQHDKVLTALGTPGLAVYLALCRIQSDAKPEEKSFFPAGAQRIARHCGLSVRSVRRYLPKLAEVGTIELQSGLFSGPHGDHEENKISLIDSALFMLPSVRESLACATESGLNGTRSSVKNRKNEKEFLGNRRKGGALPRV